MKKHERTTNEKNVLEAYEKIPTKDQRTALYYVSGFMREDKQFMDKLAYAINGYREVTQ